MDFLWEKPAFQGQDFFSLFRAENGLTAQGTGSRFTFTDKASKTQQIIRYYNIMAHHKSAQKRIRQEAKRTTVNRSRISRIRTFIKRVEKAIDSGDSSAAQTALRDAQPEIMRGVTKGVLKKGTASRKVSRLSARVKALAA
jgi:small subunit ribosomal protein S20